MENHQYLVTCLDDEIEGYRQRVLLTRRVFTSRDDAQKYCAGVSPARQAEIVACPFPINELRPVDLKAEAKANAAANAKAVAA